MSVADVTSLDVTDKKLNEIHKQPKNAILEEKFTSPRQHNEMVDLLHSEFCFRRASPPKGLLHNFLILVDQPSPSQKEITTTTPLF